MADTGLLIGMAQIAITIAGFAAVAGSLAARNEESRLDADRLVIMLINIPAGRLVATYFVGLYIGVVLSVVLLFRIVFSMLRPARPD